MNFFEEQIKTLLLILGCIYMLEVKCFCLYCNLCMRIVVNEKLFFLINLSTKFCLKIVYYHSLM